MTMTIYDVDASEQGGHESISQSDVDGNGVSNEPENEASDTDNEVCETNNEEGNMVGDSNGEEQEFVSFQGVNLRSQAESAGNRDGKCTQSRKQLRHSSRSNFGNRYNKVISFQKQSTPDQQTQQEARMESNVYGSIPERDRGSILPLQMINVADIESFQNNGRKVGSDEKLLYDALKLRVDKSND